jgi:hypothetical protein
MSGAVGFQPKPSETPACFVLGMGATAKFAADAEWSDKTVDLYSKGLYTQFKLQTWQ